MSSGKPHGRRSTLADRLIDITHGLCDTLAPLSFAAPVSVVYNPLEYGRAASDEYISRFATRRGVALLLGMNPGPWGMAQTAVPFGAVSWVRDWMKLQATVEAPPQEHPRRPVLGYSCTRTEVSGDRLWGWAANGFGEPARFFRHYFVWNYCPLSFMLESGANLIPEKLAKNERAPLFAACDEALRAAVAAIEAPMVVGIGKFAADRARRVLPESTAIGQVLHPSPASPAANRGWREAVEKQLCGLGLPTASQ